LDGSVYQYTANALELAPTGGGSLTAADVWSHATRVLTAGTNIALAKGTGVTGFNDLSAAQVNAEVDTALTDFAATTLEGSLTRDQANRIILSALAGKVSGAGTGTEVFRNTADSKDRITSTVDVNGNRTVVTLDGT
jgi:hypothetical protein